MQNFFRIFKLMQTYDRYKYTKVLVQLYSAEFSN